MYKIIKSTQRDNMTNALMAHINELNTYNKLLLVNVDYLSQFEYMAVKHTGGDSEEDDESDESDDSQTESEAEVHEVNIKSDDDMEDAQNTEDVQEVDKKND